MNKRGDENRAIPAVRRALENGCFNILQAPCVFCAYNGRGFFQSGTHNADCPVREVGGMAERADFIKGLK